MLDVTVTNQRLRLSAPIMTHAVEQFVKGKEDKHHNTHHATFKQLPLAFTTYDDHRTTMGTATIVDLFASKFWSLRTSPHILRER